MCMMPTRSSILFVISLASLSLLPNSQVFSQAPPAKKVVWPGLARDGSVLLPNGWSIKEAGRQSRLGDFPVLAEIHPTEPVIAVLHAGYGEHEVITVNTNNGKIIGRVSMPETFAGLTWSRDGKQLYVGGGWDDLVYRFENHQGLLSNQVKIGYPNTLADKKRRATAGMVSSWEIRWQNSIPAMEPSKGNGPSSRILNLTGLPGMKRGNGCMSAFGGRRRCWSSTAIRVA